MANIKNIIIAICVAISVLIFAFYTTYNVGYDNGVQYLKSEVDKVNEKWESKVKNAQLEHDKTLKTVYENHNKSMVELKKQIETLTKDQIRTESILKQYKSEGYVPKGFVLWHDRASQGHRLDVMVGNDMDKPSEYTFNDVMMVIGNNYNQYNVCRTKLTSLQEIVRSFIKEQQVTVKYEKDF